MRLAASDEDPRGGTLMDLGGSCFVDESVSSLAEEEGLPVGTDTLRLADYETYVHVSTTTLTHFSVAWVLDTWNLLTDGRE